MKSVETSMKRILVVEDEPSVCQVCVRVLTAAGFEVDIAGDGEVGKRMLGYKKYDLVLVDIRTPVLNGKELYEWMQKEYREMANNVIFTTGDMINSDIQIFLERAGRRILPKPFTPIELRTVLQEALEELKSN